MAALSSTRTMLSSLLTDIKSGTSGLWALMDQGFVSLGTFLVAIILARSMEPSSYGLYVLFVTAIVFFNNIQTSLITYPMIVRGAPMGIELFGSLVLTTLTLGAMSACVLATVATVVGWYIQGPSMGIALGAAILAWQVQLVTRSAFIARSNYRTASIGDAISFLGQAIVVGILGITTVTGVFTAMALTSMAAIAVQAWQLNLGNASLQDLTSRINDYWTLARWSVLSTLVGGLSMQFLAVSLAWTAGTSEVARYHAAANVLGLTHPILLSLSNVVLPAVAVVFSTGTVREAGFAAFKRAVPLILILVPFLLGLVLMPSLGLRVFYGPASPYIDLTTALRWFVLANLFMFGANLLGGVLDGIEKPKYRLITQVGAISTAVVIGLPLIVVFGAEGASAGYALSILVAALTAMKLVMRVEKNDDHRHADPTLRHAGLI